MIIAVIAPRHGLGQTVTAINLSAMLSEQAREKVLIVDTNRYCRDMDYYLSRTNITKGMDELCSLSASGLLTHESFKTCINKADDKSDGTYINFDIHVAQGTTSIRYRTVGFNITVGGSTIIYNYEPGPGNDLPFSFKLSSIISEYERQYANYGGKDSPQYKAAYEAMFKTGGTITFNAIMTVVYSGEKQGDIIDGARYPDSKVTIYVIFPVTYNLQKITVTGFGSGSFGGSGGTVKLTKEGTGSMSAVGTWGPPQYSASGLSDLQIPSPPDNPTGSSEIYRLDWTTPVLNYNSPHSTNGSWSRNPYNISFSIHENLSGFSGTSYSISDSSWYNRDSSGSAPGGGLDYSKSITLLDGMYCISINYGDIAGNKGTNSFGEYLVDTTAPDTAQFLFDTTTDTNVVSTNPSKCIYRNGRYEFMCDANNQVKVRIGDNLSGVTETRYLWSQSPSFPSTSNM
ncbi:MAG: hypothetical protein QHH06_15560 [Clostridiales bacterium]|jgi:hypothetical protein|nr:hypothetical protein [Eubacteriales bacterium]MDH7567852.1 hypothetical protein [Clostridiales bacterium]